MTDERQSFGIDLATRIDRTCDAFEAAWTAGTLPRLESYLSAVEEEHREAYLRALLPLEIELRAGIGEDADVTEYQQRFPDLADVVGEIFANTPPDDSLAAQATIPPPDVTGTATTADTAPVGNTRIPKQFGRYRLIRKLGQGAMGAVFLAQDEQLNRRVALKVPHRDALTAETRARFQREAQAAAGLRHPGICSIYDIGEIDGHQYISMEYIEGVSLARFAVAESGLNERQIATMVIKMARALQEAHVAGIVHRDLKPANVMIDRKGNPVIMDFGLARQIKQSGDERLTQTGMAVGSPAYMSPEQVEGRSDLIGPASDVYSLGVMLFELLTGDIPFKGSVGSVMGQILNDEPPKPSEYRPDLSVRLENACLKMMAKKVTNRIASMKDVDEALTEFVTRVAARETTGAKETSAATAKTAAELAEGRRGQIKDLIRAGHYKTAIERLEVMAADDREELAEFASWAAGRLPGVKAEREQVRSERQHLFDTARDLMRRHDYAQAAGMLEEYPPDLRTPKMQELLEEAQDLSEEVDGLQHDITKFENRNQRDELLAAVRRLLQLKPAHKRANRLLDELTRKRTGPLTKILGRRAPKFVKEMGIGREWFWLSVLVFVAAFVPMHLAMKDYLNSDHRQPSADLTINRLPSPPPPPIPEPTPQLPEDDENPPVPVDTEDVVLVSEDFEEPRIPGNSDFELFYSGPLGSWDVSGNVDLFTLPKGGNQCLDLNGVTRGRLTRSVPTQPNRRYLLKFDAAANPANGRGEARCSVLWNGLQVVDVSLRRSESTWTGPKWQQYARFVSATQAETLFEFVAANDGAGGVAIDNISVTRIATTNDSNRASPAVTETPAGSSESPDDSQAGNSRTAVPPAPVRIPVETWIIPTAERGGHLWGCIMSRSKLPSDWMKPEYKGNARRFVEKKSAFGRGVRGVSYGTTWATSHIYLKTTVTMPNLDEDTRLVLRHIHDDDAMVYVNGEYLDLKPPHHRSFLWGYSHRYGDIVIDRGQYSLFHEGENTIAVYCRNNRAEQVIDIGLKLIH